MEWAGSAKQPNQMLGLVPAVGFPREDPVWGLGFSFGICYSSFDYYSN